MEKSGAKMVMIKAEPQEQHHGGDSNSSSSAAAGHVTVPVDPSGSSYVFALPKNSPPLANVNISFAGHGGSEKKNTCKEDKYPMLGSIMKLGPCGGGGGGGGDAMDMDVRGVNRIVRVNIHHGHAVDAISVLYERNGLEEWTERWGGHGKDRTDRGQICLGSDEYFTIVRGHVGEFNGAVVLRSLTFFSNLRSFGPYGREEGMPFTLPAAGGKILGFHGRSGALIDALGTYVKMD